MPIYEYKCLDCSKKSTLLFRNLSDTVGSTPACPICGSASMHRLVSKFVHRRSWEESLGASRGSSGLDTLDESDPKSVALWLRKARQEAGGELDTEIDEVIDRVEAGDIPEEGFISDELEDVDQDL